MDGLKLFWSNTAVQQRNSVFAFWNERNQSKTYSRKLNLEIRQRTVLLKLYPEMGKKTIFESTRAIIMGHYSILYKIDANRIIITAFWDNRNDPEQLIKFLKKG